MTFGPRVATLALAVGIAATGLARADAARPSVIFVLVDTTRADRFGAAGSGLATTPALDGLAADGVRFARHFANSHATRPSLPQIVTGRYFHPSILRPFEPDAHPRDYPFLEPDPSARLLTDLVRANGFHVVGVTAHPWVDPQSVMGRAFHRLDYLPAPPKRGHAEAPEVVDRAVALWDERPRDRPTFLYVHLLDAHTPRRSPAEQPAFLPPGPPWGARFGRNGEPRFGEERRRWEFTDARDFTARDREVYRAFYDTLLRQADDGVGRLLAHVRRGDPTLAHTLIVVVADHGEQLGEEGRLKHGDGLHDAVQHIPLIIAGSGVRAGQSVDAFTENVDVAPTLAGLLGIDLPAGTFDGRVLLDGQGHVAVARIRRPAVFYAWSDYQAVRTKRWLLRVDPPGSPVARCRGSAATLWRLGEDGSREVVSDERRTRVLHGKIRRRLQRGADRLEQGLRRQPREPFFVSVEHWSVEDLNAIRCVPIDGGVQRADLASAGWLLVRGGLVIVDGTPDALTVTLTVPDGTYEVAAGVRPLGRLWRIPGLFGQASEALRGEQAESFVSLGRIQASGRRLRVVLPAGVASDQRVVNLRLTPLGAAAKVAPTIDREHEERLRTLGYVE